MQGKVSEKEKMNIGLFHTAMLMMFPGPLYIDWL